MEASWPFWERPRRSGITWDNAAVSIFLSDLEITALRCDALAATQLGLTTRIATGLRVLQCWVQARDPQQLESSLKSSNAWELCAAWSSVCLFGI